MNLVSGNDEVKDETVPHRVDSLRSLYGVFGALRLLYYGPAVLSFYPSMILFYGSIGSGLPL